MGQFGHVEGKIWKNFLKKKVINIFSMFNIRENLEIGKNFVIKKGIFGNFS